MLRNLLLIAMVLTSLVLTAHPGVGIVMDSKGNIFYTDLTHVWKITPDGRKSIAVRNVHTHELCMDVRDNLYGEHLWYEGEASDKWGHRIWRLSTEGILTDIIPARERFRTDYDDFSFVRDGEGNMYWTEDGHSSVIKKRSTDGSVSVVAIANFQDVRWMTVTSDGSIFLTDLYDLMRITNDGQISTIAKNLPDKKPDSEPDPHAVMGLWTDNRDNVYAAVFSERVVKKIDANNHVQIVARSASSWAPTGGLIAPSGDLWILECSTTNAVRVRRIDRNGKSTVF